MSYQALSSLREAFRSEPAEGDSSVNGDVNTSRMSKSFLSRSALPTDVDNEDLTAQLASQVDQNNQLLEKLYQLEKQQLETQREAQDRQSVLRQTINAAEALRRENADLQRSLNTAQEVSDSLREECKRFQVENGILARELEGMRKYTQESDDYVSQFRNENSQLKDENAELRAQVSEQ